jgi:ring-1,2-phenylacetyl-CoA epoxidase subunit PaaC
MNPIAPSSFAYLLHLADNALILGQRNSEWTGHGPVLEQDIAITNISLDLFGQTRNLFQYAASCYNEMSGDDQKAVDQWLPNIWRSFGRELQEDDLAFLRDEHQYFNLLLNELPRGDWAVTVLRQFFFSAFQHLQYTALVNSSDTQLAAIAEKGLKEATYHLRWSSEWVIRLGDGTEESRERITQALSDLWPFTGELLQPASYELEAAQRGFGVGPSTLRDAWMEKVDAVFSEAGLQLPAKGWMQSGGKQGRHTEHMGILLAELQYLQRTYPNLTW